MTDEYLVAAPKPPKPLEAGVPNPPNPVAAGWLVAAPKAGVATLLPKAGAAVCPALEPKLNAIEYGAVWKNLFRYYIATYMYEMRENFELSALTNKLAPNSRLLTLILGTPVVYLNLY